MSIKTRAIDYAHNQDALEGMLAYDSAQSGERPAVLVAHAWSGRTDFEINIAKKLALLGYAGIAIDLYGKGVVGSSLEENEKLMSPFVADRPMLQSRLLHIVDVVKALPEANPNKIAAIGFCFGGMCVLDIARTGAPLCSVASFHGLYTPPGNTDGNKISAKVAAYHGFGDPMATPDTMVALGQELTKADADWQIHAYGQTAHSFTNPKANNPDFGTVYSKKASDRSWTSLVEFLAECFS